MSTSQPEGERRGRRQLLLGFVVVVTIAASDVAGYALHSPIAGVNAIWPSAGVLLGLQLLFPRRDWAVIMLAAVVANFAVDLRSASSPAIALAGAVANVLESWLAAAVVRRFGGHPITLGSLRQVVALVLGAAIVSNAVTAVLGSLVISRFLGTQFWRNWLIWWVGDGLGMLVFTPLLLTVVAAARRGTKFHRHGNVVPVMLALLGGVLAYALIVGERGAGIEMIALEYAVFPILIWIAVRHDLWASAVAVAVLATVVMLEVTLVPASAVPNGASPVPQIIHLYMFIALASVSSLVPAAVTNERRTAMVDLAASELRFRQLAEHIREAFVIADLEALTVVYASPTWAEIWGQPLAAASEPGVWTSSTHPDDHAILARQIAIVRQGGDGAAIFRVRRPDVALRWVRGRAYPVRDATGAVYRATAVFEDITELRQAEQRLNEGQKMDALGRLAGGIAHDFNNLLTVMGSAAEMLETALPDGHPGRVDVAAITRASMSGRGLTRQLLAFSRQQPVQPRAVALHPLIAETASLIERLIGKQVALDCRLEAADDVVFADPQQIEQVLVNLAINARDAMPDGGRLVISSRNLQLPAEGREVWLVRPPQAFLCLAVSDSGCGMTPETKAHLFEPFFTTKPAGKGTGLGLATVFSIVQSAGGFVNVESEPGRGSTFEVLLPLAEAAPMAGTGDAGVPR